MTQNSEIVKEKKGNEIETSVLSKNTANKARRQMAKWEEVYTLHHKAMTAFNISRVSTNQ